MKRLLTRLGETARLMIGQPSYEAYLAHMAAHHPNEPVLDRIAFFRNRERARYAGKGGGKCC